jgi:hypothetical protein
MALFNGQILYPRDIDQDQSWGSNIKQLSGTAGADSDFTMTFTSTSSTTLTMIPYTNVSGSSTNDTRTDNGWALNEAESSNDGMGSISTRKRVIPAGDWIFAIDVDYTAPALLTSYDIQAEMSVYRVATGGGSRSLLFTGTSNTITVDLEAGSGTLTTTSSQGEYIIEPGETIHVATRITSAATEALLGSTTNSVITIPAATSGALTYTLPSPGLRSLYFDSNSSVSEYSSTRSTLTQKDAYSSTGVFIGALDKAVDFYRSFLGTADHEGSRPLLAVMKELQSTADSESTKDLYITKGTLSSVIDAESTRALLLQKDVVSAIAEASGSIDKVVEYVRGFEGTVDSLSDFEKAVIYVRGFESTMDMLVRPRICLDWDDLPDPGEPVVIGGGGACISYPFAVPVGIVTFAIEDPVDVEFSTAPVEADFAITEPATTSFSTETPRVTFDYQESTVGFTTQTAENLFTTHIIIEEC